MAIYLYKCKQCGTTLELQFAVGQAPDALPCPYDCGGDLERDYAAHYRTLSFIPLKEVEREENRISEADLPTPEAVAALHAFGSIPEGRSHSSNLIAFSIGED